MEALTPEQKLATTLLRRDVFEWMAEQRHPTPDLERSWRKVAANLTAATDGQVTVTGQTLMRWAASPRAKSAPTVQGRSGDVAWEEPPLPLDPSAA